MKKFKVKLESVDPTGVAFKKEELSMELFDSESKVDRFLLYVGDCVYKIDHKGHILSELTDNNNNKPEPSLTYEWRDVFFDD